MGGIGIWQLLVVAVIVILLFGTKKLRNIGGDLGSAIKGFKKAINEDDNKKVASSTDSLTDSMADNSKESDTHKNEKVTEKDQA